MAIVAAQSAFAQAAEQDESSDKKVKTLNEVQVTGDATSKEVTLGSFPATLRETPQSVTVIDAIQIGEQGLYNLDAVLAQTPGVIVEQRTTDESYFYIRGQQVESFEYDGMVMSGTPWLSGSPNMDMIDQVEVLRGANGVLTGASGFGTVNVLRKRPADEFKLSTMLSYGSWDSKHAMLDVGGPLSPSGRLRGRAVASYDDRDFFYDVAHKNTNLYYGLLEFDVTENTLLTVSAHKQDVDSTPIVFGLVRNSDGSDPGFSRSTYPNTAWSNFFLHEKVYYASLETRFDNGWKASLSFNRQEGDSHYKYGYFYGGLDAATGNTNSAYGTYYDFTAQNDVVDVKLSGDITLFGRQHQIMVGGNWIRSEAGWWYSGYDFGTVSPLGWDPYAITEPADPAAFPYYSPRPEEVEQSGLFVSGKFNLTDSLHLLASARLSWWKYSGMEMSELDPSYLWSLDYKITREITPQAALVWDFAGDWSAYFSYADVFEPQSDRTYSGEQLDPVVGANYELGVKGELLGQRLNVSAALFRVEQTNRPEIDMEHTVFDDGAGGSMYYYVATGETRSEGVELSLSGSPVRGLTINGGYTYNTTEYTRSLDYQGLSYATYIPKHMARLWASYILPFADERWSVGAGIHAQSRVDRSTETYPYLAQGGYTLFNARVGYKCNEFLSIALNGNNLGDKTYFTRVNNSPGYFSFYGEPRSVVFTVTASFQ